MKRIIITVLVLFTGLSAVMAQTPEVYVTGGQNHVQGIAYDSAMDRMYLSFTTSFLVTDMQGNVIASIDRIQGHPYESGTYLHVSTGAAFYAYYVNDFVYPLLKGPQPTGETKITGSNF